MKKLLIILCLLFIFRPCSAPNFTGQQRKNQIIMSVYDYYLNEYEKEFTCFVNHLGFRETRNDWTAINSYGYFGEFQFGSSALERIGYGHITMENFKLDPTIFPREDQIDALKTLILYNELDLNRKISEFSDARYSDYIGKTINGVYISKGGLLAGMHLGGLGGIKAFLITEGKVDKSDAYGTKISDYMREFSLYNLSRDYLKVEKYLNDENFVLNEKDILSSFN